MVPNDTSDRVVVPSSELFIRSNIALKVDVCKSDFGLNEWEIIRGNILDSIHDTLWIKDQLDLSILVHDWWDDVLQNWGVLSSVGKPAIALAFAIKPSNEVWFNSLD